MAKDLEIVNGDAQFILTKLYESGKVRKSQIDWAIRQKAAEAQNLQREIEALQERLVAMTGATSSLPLQREDGRRTRKQTQIVDPKLAKSRQKQGKYIGLLRHFGTRDRKRFQKLAHEEGRDAALKAMRQSLKEKNATAAEAATTQA